MPMTKRQQTMRHLVTCYDRLALCRILNQKNYYWKKQIEKGLKIVNIKPWSI